MRAYTISGANITVANAAVTLIQVNTAASGSGSAIEILRAWVSQSANATSAQQRIQWHTKVTAFPTLVSATPQKLSQGDPASGITGATTGAAGTAGINASAEGGGAETVIWPDAFNVLNGWLWVPTPHETITLGPSTALGLKFPAAPATLSGWSFGLVYIEII